MNRLLTPLTNAIVERKGTIDKYIGDAIMAFWNAPLDDKDHESHACAAALDMLRKMAELNRERQAEALEDGKPFFPINIGLGINTGTCVVGNMGSDLRFDYSVLGDSVNLASRLEGRSKSYGTADYSRHENRRRRWVINLPRSRSTSSPSRARPSRKASMRLSAMGLLRKARNSRPLLRSSRT